MSFNRSFTLKPIEPPVAWKNEPWGKWSSVVAPALIIAAPHTAATPAATIASPNDADAMVAPAVVDAVAADMSEPAIGAMNVPPLLQPSSIPTSTSLIDEALMIPANVPVPTSKIAIPDIFSKPYVKQLAIFFQLPVAKIPTIPPTGNAIIGSTTMPAMGRNARRMIVTIGPSKLNHNGGNFSSSSSVCKKPSGDPFPLIPAGWQPAPQG